jgi:hypothetical protein
MTLRTHCACDEPAAKSAEKAIKGLVSQDAGLFLLA